MTDLAIRTESLGRNFGSLKAVVSLCLEVPRGIIFGFLGPNGAGKTTTIRLLLGLLEPSGGGGQVAGFDIVSQAGLVRTSCGALLEHPGLYERLTAEQNIEFYGRVYCLKNVERASRSKELLTHLGLWERRKERVGEWSKGMKQKLAIARALLHRPQILFLDEPTAGLDPVAAAALRRDLDQFVAYEGVTVFLTTHNLAEAEKLCDRVAVINKGKLLAQGPPGDLRGGSSAVKVEIRPVNPVTPDILKIIQARPEVSSIDIQDSCLCLTLNPGAGTAPLVSLLVSLGVEVEEVRKTRLSLEESFLKILEEENK